MPDPSAALGANPWAAAPGAILGLAETAVSLINRGKAVKEAKELQRTRPKREISDELGQTLSLAESELAGGMSTAAERAYNNAMDRQMAGSLSAILRGGGSVNNVGEVFGAGEEGRQRLAMLTDQLRTSQIDSVVKARQTMAEEQDKNFIFNDWMPWKDRQAANAEARQGAEKGIWSGLETVGNAASAFLSNPMGGGGGSDNGDGGVSNFWLNAAGALPRTQAGGPSAVSPAASLSPGFRPAAQSTPLVAQPPAYDWRANNPIFNLGGG